MQFKYLESVIQNIWIQAGDCLGYANLNLVVFLTLSNPICVHKVPSLSNASINICIPSWSPTIVRKMIIAMDICKSFIKSKS